MCNEKETSVWKTPTSKTRKHFSALTKMDNKKKKVKQNIGDGNRTLLHLVSVVTFVNEYL